MTRTSTSRFGRTFTALVVVLVTLCGVFVALGYLQGPKLTDAQLSGQELRLFANQPVSVVTAEQVTVSPDARVSVTTTGDVIAVQFIDPLNYATDYVVRVDGVRSLALPQPGTLEYGFTTASAALYYLDRSEFADDIVRTSLTDTERTVVFSADRILDFAVVGSVLAVVSLDVNDATLLQLVSLTDGAVETIPLPEAGVVSDLQVSSVGFLLGVVFTPTSAIDEPLGGRELLVLDLNAGRTFTPVAGLDGKPLTVADWGFVPGGTSLVAQGVEQTLLLVDAAASGIPTPLGQFSELVSFSNDGATMVVRDSFGAVSVALADGSETRIEPSLIEGGPPFIGEIVPLVNGSIVEKAALQTDGGVFVVVLAVDDGASGRVVYIAPKPAGSIGDFSVSPNDQYIAVEVTPDNTAAVSDNYPQEPRSTTVITVIVDVATGVPVGTVEGFGLQFVG